jgi:hypothetical protein
MRISMIIFLFFDNPSMPGCKDPDVQAHQDCQRIKRRSLISSRWIYWYDPVRVGYIAIGNQGEKFAQEWQRKDDMTSN